MYGYGIGQVQAVALLELILNESVVKLNREGLGKIIDLRYDANVSVEHTLTLFDGNAESALYLPYEVVVILYLHDLVTKAEQGTVYFLLRFLSVLWIKLFLK